MVVVNVLDFLETGWFGPLRAGVTRAEIRDALGEPDAWLPEHKDDSGIWLYGDFEFHFGDPTDRAWMIFSDDPGSNWPRPSPALQVDPWILREGLAIDEAREVLRAHGLAFEEWTDTRPDAIVLTVASGVDLEFHREDDAGPFRFGAIEQLADDRRLARERRRPPEAAFEATAEREAQ